LQATLNAHRLGTVFREVPALQMLASTKAEIEARAHEFVAELLKSGSAETLDVNLIDGESAIGGGSGPNTHPATVLIAVAHAQLSADQIEEQLRANSPPVIVRVAEGKVLVDLRTVTTYETPELVAALSFACR
jgi:L-seryl-tRNA(Ser) seleniumtransferase